MQQRTFKRKLDNANRAHRTAEPVTKTPNIDPQQAAKHYSYGRFVRNDQHIAIRKLTLDFINHPQAARGYSDRQLAIGWRMPGRIGKPTHRVVVIFAAD